MRFVDGAPSLETLIGSTPQSICAGVSAPCYLTVNGQNETQLFFYGSMTSFKSVAAGTLSLSARDTAGYRVGPLKSPPLKAGQNYTVAIVGSYPDYQVLAFEEPKSSGAQLSLYEASPSVPDIDFGRFNASTGSGFTKLGSAHFGNVVTVSLGASAADVGGYAGHGTTPLTNGKLIVSQVNGFDSQNVLPFHNAGRLSLFLLDAANNGGPVFGSLDP